MTVPAGAQEPSSTRSPRGLRTTHSGLSRGNDAKTRKPHTHTIRRNGPVYGSRDSTGDVSTSFVIGDRAASTCFLWRWWNWKNLAFKKAEGSSACRYSVGLSRFRCVSWW